MSLEYNEQVFVGTVEAIPTTVEGFNKFANEISKATFLQTIHAILTGLDVLIVNKVEQVMATRIQAEKFYKDHPELGSKKLEVAKYIDKLKMDKPELTIEELFKGNGSYKGLAVEFKAYYEDL